MAYVTQTLYIMVKKYLYATNDSKIIQVEIIHEPLLLLVEVPNRLKNHLD